MPSDARSELQRLLRDDFKLVAGLSDADLAQLNALVQAARQKQRDAIKEAQAHALRFVPALLRKPLLALLTD
jgi:hypothetical protein